jgi:hypothetical protein
MDHEVRTWKMAFFHGPTSWSNFHDTIFKKKQFTKPLGPSLGVNQMWTSGIAMHQKVNVLIFLIYAQKG